MSFYSDNIVSENLNDIKNLRVQSSVQATANSTKSLTSLSESYQVFTGTTAGQLINLPDATTLLVGHTYWVLNESTENIIIRDNGGNSLTTSLPSTTSQVIVRDNSTSNGAWISRKSSVASPTGRTITLSFPSASGQATPGFTTKSTTLVPAARFIFQGSSQIGQPVSLSIISSIESPGTGTFRIIDITNANNVIAGPFQFTNSALATNLITTFSNIPSGEAIFEVQLATDIVNREVELDGILFRLRGVL